MSGRQQWEEKEVSQGKRKNTCKIVHYWPGPSFTLKHSWLLIHKGGISLEFCVGPSPLRRAHHGGRGKQAIACYLLPMCHFSVVKIHPISTPHTIISPNYLSRISSSKVTPCAKAARASTRGKDANTLISFPREPETTWGEEMVKADNICGD